MSTKFQVNILLKLNIDLTLLIFEANRVGAEEVATTKWPHLDLGSLLGQLFSSVSSL